MLDGSLCILNKLLACFARLLYALAFISQILLISASYIHQFAHWLGLVYHTLSTPEHRCAECIIPLHRSRTHHLTTIPLLRLLQERVTENDNRLFAFPDEANNVSLSNSLFNRFKSKERCWCLKQTGWVVAYMLV